MIDPFWGQSRQLTAADILPRSDYLPVRRERRRQISEVKRRRRVEVGPFAAFHFENFWTMRQQVQEILYIEKGGEAQLQAKIDAYNPLIPQGSELVATLMFEIGDPVRRIAELRRLGGIENHAFIEVDGCRLRGEPDRTRENASREGKGSAVQFLRFRLVPETIARFKAPGAQIVLGFDHPNYAHMAAISEPVRAVLAEDFA